MPSMIPNASDVAPKSSLLPKPGSAGYHLLLGAVAIFILGPLGGITAAYMNFSLGFFVGGQVLAGILGSAVTFGYGAEGKHGANYIQTMAASVAGMAAMAVLIQAMTWLGFPEPPALHMIVYFVCIGMFGVGVGMLYTPILVDKLQLTYPSGLAVANILRALTDRRLLKRSIAQLGAGTGAGFLGGFLADKIEFLGKIGTSTSTFGAGMVVGARIAVPAIVVGLIGELMTPYFRAIGWLGAHDPFRKIGFLIALGAIMGAAAVDLALLFVQALKKFRERAGATVEAAPDWKRTNTLRLVLWVAFWGVGITLSGTLLLHLPLFYVLFAIALVFLFVLINGISLGITDQNPISSAFVVCVLLMALLGLRDPGAGLMSAAILLIACSVGCDMQQDRSTGWRLGTNRVLQFRYQVIGIVMGAVMAVVMAKLFMAAYPVLKIDTFSHPEAKVAQWQSAMTYKFVGVLRDLAHPQGHKFTAMMIGLGIGLATEVIRKLVLKSAGYRRWKASGKVAFAADFTIDAIVLPSPYASSFGGFVEFITCLWIGVGGIASSVAQAIGEQQKKAGAKEGEELPEDMSTTSLIGGGLIAGDSLAALVLGVIGLLSLM
ncbi:MAG: peptide transporter [Myxococcales bacterium]|nr:peptide transporter [Myxococcales bacterium]